MVKILLLFTTVTADNIPDNAFKINVSNYTELYTPSVKVINWVGPEFTEI